MGKVGFSSINSFLYFVRVYAILRSCRLFWIHPCHIEIAHTSDISIKKVSTFVKCKLSNTLNMFSSKKSPKSLEEIDSAMPCHACPFLRSLIYNTFREVQLVASHNLGWNYSVFLWDCGLGTKWVAVISSNIGHQEAFHAMGCHKKSTFTCQLVRDGGASQFFPIVVQWGLSSVNLPKKQPQLLCMPSRWILVLMGRLLQFFARSTVYKLIYGVIHSYPK